MKKFFITFLLLLGLIHYAYNIEPNRLIVKNIDLKLENWDFAFDGLRAVVVSDLHIGTNKVSLNRLIELVDKINAQKPDIVFLLGDFDAVSIQYSKIPTSEISKELSLINAPLGKFAILGNHDYEPEGIVQPILSKAGIVLLEDNSAKININGKKLRISGARDWWHYDVDVRKILGTINEPTIFLSHNPDAFPEVPQDVALTLCGHTHGGEIALPIIGGLHIPSVYGKKYAKGLVKEKQKTLFVTSGMASLSRFRTFNPPEIVVLKLVS